MLWCISFFYVKYILFENKIIVQSKTHEKVTTGNTFKNQRLLDLNQGSYDIIPVSLTDYHAML